MLAIIPLIGDVTDVVVTWACEGYWAKLPTPTFSVLLLPCQGQVCSLVIGVEVPRSVSELCFWSAAWERQSWSAPTGRKVTEFSPLELFTCVCVLLCHFSPLVLTHKLHYCWNCPQPHLNHGYSGSCSWFFSGLVFTKPPVQIPQSHPRTAVIMCLDPLWELMETAQIRTCSSPPVYVPTKPTAAKARPISDAGALIHSDILQVLSFQSQQQWCKSMVLAAMTRESSSSSFVAWPQGLNCGFSPTSACVPPSSTCTWDPSKASAGGGSNGQGVQAHWGQQGQRRYWQEGSGSLLRWVLLLVPTKAGDRGRGHSGGPASCAPLSNGILLLWRPRFLSQTFLIVELLIPAPSDLSVCSQ